MSKTIYLHLEPYDISPESGATVELKLDELGILVEAWSLDSRIASTYKTYSELDIELKDINMSKVKNNEENREKLAEAVVESMEMKDMIQALYEEQLHVFEQCDDTFQELWDIHLADKDIDDE